MILANKSLVTTTSGGAFHPVEPFLLDDAVDPLGDRVVGRLVVLRHADRGFNGL